MGSIKHLASKSEHALLARHVVGREGRCDLCIDDLQVSGLHAELRWTGTMWEIRDLNSVNGTWVDGRKLEPKEQIPLPAGSTIAFGETADLYELADDSEPLPIAIGPAGQRQAGEAGLLAIPSPEDPRYTIFQDRGVWTAEFSDGEQRRLAGRDSVRVDGAVWQLYLPETAPRTLRHHDQQMPLRAIGLRFSVSRDEEHIELDIVHDGRHIRLPARAYWYMLLTLARTRMADHADETVSDVEEGWVNTHELAAMLAVELGLLHQYICRARKTFSRAGVLDFAGLIERRSTTRQLRLGTSQIEIISL